MISPCFLISTFIKTIRFNMHYFCIKTALKFPVVVSHNVHLKKMGGRVEIQGEIKRGMVRIGFGDIGIFDKHRSRAIWCVTGCVAFGGRVDIGHGVKINVHDSGELVFGENFIVNAETSIVCRKQIVFGRKNLISWQCMITDTDFHTMWQHGERINDDQPVCFGERVWVGMRVTILKGAKIANGAVIGAGSIVSQHLDNENCVYAGNPAKIVKDDINWSL